MLSGSDLNKRFGDTEVLDSVTIDICPGEIAVLTGPSGSGKSTLIRILALLDPPDSGTIILDNKRFTFPMTNDSSCNSIYPTVTSVFQQLYLWPHLTNRENILLALRYDKQVDKDALDLYIKLFEMHAFIDKFPNQSSLGQRQRVALTRAFVLKSKYLLLDEVTSALDSKNTELILSELERKCAEGQGVLIITHDIQIAAKRNLKVYILENGQTHIYK